MKYFASAGKAWRKKSCINHCERLDLRSQNDKEAEFLAKLFHYIRKREDVVIRFDHILGGSIVPVHEDIEWTKAMAEDMKNEISDMCSFGEEEF